MTVPNIGPSIGPDIEPHIEPHIDVMPGHDYWPLWVGGRGLPRANANPASLPLPDALVADLSCWAAEFDDAAGFPHPDDEDDFWMRGRILAGRIAFAVAGSYRVLYFDGRLDRLIPILPDAGTRIDGGRAILPSHWRDVSASPEVCDALGAELDRELPVGHVLAGHSVTVVARCEICDDVLIPVDESAYAVVHLTWKRETNPNSPSVEVHSDAGALLADLSERHPGRA